MTGTVYMMFCERARPAGNEEGWARPSRQGTFAKLKAYSRTKSNGMPDISGPWGEYKYRMY